MRNKKKKAQWYVHVWYLVPLGIYATFWGSFIGYIWHCGFLWDVYMSFHSLSHSCYAFGVSRVHVRVLWDPMLLGSWLIYIRYERWVTFLLGTPNHCLIPTIPSFVIWLSFIVLTWVDHHSFYFLIAFFCISLPLSRSLFHLLFISYILIHIINSIPSSHHSHISLMVWPFILSLISLSTFPLVTSKSMTHEIFLCITSCTRGYGFDHWVFEPSFPSFLSPYHSGLRYVPCLKTTLRPRDQTLSLTVFTWTGFW